jgi:hypothetical protein
MNISDQSRKTLVDEIRYVAEKMGKTKDRTQKIFYFSAIHGTISRIFNLEYDAELVYLHFILQQTYIAFKQGVDRLKGIDILIPIAEEQFDKLTKLSKELASKIQKKEGTDKTAKEFILLAYTMTGNGYYLMEKGVLKI